MTDLEDAFLAALEHDRSDTVTRLAYADWLHERDRGAEAYAQRWMVARKKWPVRRVQGRSRIQKPYAWFPQWSDDPEARDPARLPPAVYLHLSRMAPPSPRQYLYWTAREAEASLVEAIEVVLRQIAL